MFFQDSGGTLYPVAEIESVYREDQVQERIYWAVLKSGNTHRLMAGEYENLRRANSPFFSSTPGHFVLDLDYGSSSKDDPVIRTPIVGWCICPEQGTIPITLDGPNDGKNSSACVLFPSGHIQIQEAQIFETLEDYVDHNKPEGWA
jgi:hypothetical protein